VHSGEAKKPPLVRTHYLGNFLDVAQEGADGATDIPMALSDKDGGLLEQPDESNPYGAALKCLTKGIGAGRRWWRCPVDKSSRQCQPKEDSRWLPKLLPLEERCAHFKELWDKTRHLRFMKYDYFDVDGNARTKHNETVEWIPFDLHEPQSAVNREFIRSVYKMWKFKNCAGFGPFVPLPLFFEDFTAHYYVKGMTQNMPMDEYWQSQVRDVLRSDVLYIIPTWGDHGLRGVYDIFPNIIVLSGGGYGNAPIPLWKHDFPPHPLAKTAPLPPLPVTFTGKFHFYTRKRLFEELLQRHWTIGDMKIKKINAMLSHKRPIPKPQSKKDTVTIYHGEYWHQVLQATKVHLTARGYGRSAFAIQESITFGLVPVFIYDDIPWIPYHEKLDYGQFAAVANISEISATLDAFLKIDEATYRQMRANVLAVRKHFTLEGVLNNVLEFMAAPEDPQASAISCVVRPYTMGGRFGNGGGARSAMIPGVAVVAPGSETRECCVPPTINRTMIECRATGTCAS